MHATADPIVVQPDAGAVTLVFGRPQLVIGNSPDMLELIRELGSNPREAWDEIGARYDTHLAYDHPDFPRA